MSGNAWIFSVMRIWSGIEKCNINFSQRMDVVLNARFGGCCAAGMYLCVEQCVLHDW